MLIQLLPVTVKGLIIVTISHSILKPYSPINQSSLRKYVSIYLNQNNKATFD